MSSNTDQKGLAPEQIPDAAENSVTIPPITGSSNANSESGLSHQNNGQESKKRPRSTSGKKKVYDKKDGGIFLQSKLFRLILEK